MSVGLTFDTGALIALERRRQRIARVYSTAVEDGIPVTVPAVVVAEWWRGRTDARATTIDAIVRASAARRGDVVYTSDFPDLERLRTYFPAVRLLAI